MASFIGIHTYMFYTYIQVTYGGALMENKLLAVGQRQAGKRVLRVGLHAALYHGPESSITHASLGSSGAVQSQLSDLTVSVSRCREGRSRLFFFDSVQREVNLSQR